MAEVRSAPRPARRQLSDIGDIGSGMDTARPISDLDPATAAVRAQRRAAARTNLAAFMCELYEVDPLQAGPADLVVRIAAVHFAELIDILGLDHRPAPAGMCATCGGTRALSSIRTGYYKPGLCWWCSHGTPRPDRPGTPAAVTLPVSTAPPGTGQCLDCGGRRYRLTPTGRFLPHPAWRLVGDAWTRCTYDCPGSGELASGGEE